MRGDMNASLPSSLHGVTIVVRSDFFLASSILPASKNQASGPKDFRLRSLSTKYSYITTMILPVVGFTLFCFSMLSWDSWRLELWMLTTRGGPVLLLSFSRGSRSRNLLSFSQSWVVENSLFWLVVLMGNGQNEKSLINQRTKACWHLHFKSIVIFLPIMSREIVLSVHVDAK